MGRTLLRAVHEVPGFALAGAVDRQGAAEIGADTGTLAGLSPSGIKVTSDASPLVGQADAIIDFTSPDSSIALAGLAAGAGIVHVIGTTGMSKEDDAKLEAAARQATIVKSGNMSLGVNLLAALVKRAAASLGPEFDIEILEIHHNRKVDAPSGTGLLLGKAAADGRKIDLEKHSVRSRDGHTGARRVGDIGFATATTP